MSKRIIKLVFFLAFLMSLIQQSVLAAEIVVIVNPKNALSQISQQELIHLYMGRYTHFNTNEPAQLLDSPMDSALRKAFYQILINKSVAEVNAYWARLIFTGRNSPPKPISGAKNIIEFIHNNQSVMGYIYKKDYDDSLKVVYQFDTDS